MKNFNSTTISTVLETIKKQTSQIVATCIEVDEKQIVDAEETALASKAGIASLEKQACNMLQHLDDLDNCGCRCRAYCWLTGGCRGKDPVKLFDTWIPDYLQMMMKGNHVKVDWAHGYMILKTRPNKCPRALILKFHNFRDKQRVMEARRLGSLNQDASTSKEFKVSLFSDFSAEVV